MSPTPRSLARLTRMRILALPLTAEASTSGQHTYYHFQTPAPVETNGKPSLLKKVTGKAAELWAGFGKAPEGSWKQRTFKYGERIVDRIDFEELALKSMDPSLGPKIFRLGKSAVQIKEKDNAPLPIPLVHPVFYGSKTSPLLNLQALLKKRTPDHRRGFYFWMFISPLTAPFMLIPVIPNLPFFFCVWRSWHHYKAFKASSYLEALLKRGLIEPESNIGLDRIYEKYRPASDSSTTLPLGSRSNVEGRILLSKEAVPKIVSFFELPPIAEADLYRALDQTGKRLRKA
ncbi:mitochondrial K+-H+ exchange-related-domain-containing protein [Phellopilus nigrolimitatus]|nr:mitochondrial K+-H+ exchange-related-domain-containing protein [Phellopilus nigrolimitatus]